MNERQLPQATIGLALSGGTFKGAAHIGVLEALENIGLRPDYIAGTSAGAIVGTLYAHGYNIKELRTLVETFPIYKLLDYGFPISSSFMSSIANRILPKHAMTRPCVPNGLIRGKKFQRYLERLLRARQVHIPFYVVATDLVSGKPVTFNRNSATAISRDGNGEITNIAQAVRGSCALPGLFTPVMHDEYLLVDGAFRHYVPVDVLRQAGCNKIIAVNLYRLTSDYRPHGLVEVLSRAFDILLRESIDNEIDGEDLFVIEPDFTSFKVVGFTQMVECIELGKYEITRQENEIKAFAMRPPSVKQKRSWEAQDPVIRIL